MKLKSNPFLSAAFAVSLISICQSSFGAQIYKDVTTADMNTVANWSTVFNAATPNPGSIGTTDTLRFNEMFAPTSGTNYTASISGDLTVGGIKLDNGSGGGGAPGTGNVTINGTNTLTLNGTLSGESQYASAVFVLNSGTGGTLTVNPNIIIGVAGTQIVASRALNLNGTLNWGTFGMTNNIAGGTTTVAGVVSGSGNWAKSGGGTYYFSNTANTFTGSVTATGGTLKVNKLADGGSNSSIGAGSSTITLTGSTLEYAGTTADSTNRPITMGGNATISSTGSGTVSVTAANVSQSGTASARTLTLTGTNTGINTFGSIIGDSGSGANITSLTKSGLGAWILSGPSTYTGATSVNAGRLNLTGSLTSAITVASGGTLSGTGGTNGTLAMNAGSNFAIAGGATTASSFLANAVNLAGATSVSFDTAPVVSTIYTVFNYGAGGLTGLANLAPGTGHATFADTTTAVTLTYLGTTTSTWSTTSGTWNTATTNWSNSIDNKYGNGDTVVFNDPASTSVVTLVGTIVPASVSVSNTNAYTFTGAPLSGSTGLTKSGSGVLTLSSANTFTGNVVVNGGTLKIGNGTALGISQAGNPVTQIVIGSGGALDLNGVASIFGYTLSGTGVGGTGALVNTGAAVSNGNAQVSNLKLGADASVGGSGNWSLLTNSYGATNLDLNAFTLTKTGANTIALVNTTTTAGTVQVAGGTLALGVAENTAGITGSASAFTLDNTSGAALSVVKSSSVGSLAGGGATGGNVLLGATLTVGALNTPTTYAGVLSGTGGALTKVGTSSLTLSNANTYTGLTTVNAGTLAVTANTSLGSNLANAPAETSAIVDFGANTLTLGNVTAGNNGAFFYGKLVGTGALQLRGGSQTIQNSDGTGSTSGNFQILSSITAAMPASAFALDTGSSVTDRKDFGFINDTNDVLTLSSLTGFGAIRGDSNGPATRHITVAQSSGDTVFNGALLSHKSTGGSVRALTFEKTGSSALELAGFVGKETASATAGAAAVNLTANGGILSVTNATNTTTTNTDAINLGTVTVTSGTLEFSAQALINTAGSAGATSIAMNGGTLKWNAANTQDITAGNRLTLVSGKTATFNTNGNDVALANALGGGAIAAAVTKEGSGKLTLGTNTYTGDTTVNAGTLAVNGTSIDNANKLVINGGQVEPTGTETVNTLYFGAAQRASGTWGSTASGATHQDDTHFSGTGILNVTTGSAASYGAWETLYSLGSNSENGDSDADGIKNLMEYVLGGIPSGASASDTSILPSQVLNPTNLVLTFHRSDLSESDTAVKVQWSADLVTWTDFATMGAGDALPAVDVTEDSPTAALDTVVVTIPRAGREAGGKLFGRVTAIK